MYLGKQFTFAANSAKRRVNSLDARAKYLQNSLFFIHFYANKRVIGIILGNELKWTPKPVFGKHKNNFETFLFNNSKLNLYFFFIGLSSNIFKIISFAH